MDSESGFSTKSIHGGIEGQKEGCPTTPPIVASASFAYERAEELENVFSGKSFGYVYSRIANPTVQAFERKIAGLENGVGAIAAASGMSAIAAAMVALVQSGDEIVAGRSLFGGTFLLFEKVLKKFGVKTLFVDPCDADAFKRAVNDKTRAVFIETIGNPKLDVPDVSSIASSADRHGVPLIVDGTLTTPYLFQAREHGAAVSIHSTTKYICGNGSVIGGVLVDLGNFDWTECRTREISESARRFGKELAFLAYTRKVVAQNLGFCLSPFNAYLQNLGVETLEMRMERHCTNAMALARFLESHARVERVSYPGLSGHPSHERARRQFKGKFGGILASCLGSRERAFSLINRLRLAKNVANLGDAKTLIIHPASTIYTDCTPEEKSLLGVTEDMVRISAGIENEQDIIEDFSHALGHALGEV